MTVFASIVCAVDFSDQSREALIWALALAAADGASLSVVHVVDPILARAAELQYNVDLAAAEVAPELEAFVASVKTQASWRAPIACRAIVGDAADQIVAFAHHEHADLVVMGTQGLGGARKLLLGSTTERVLKRTDVSVLAVPPAGDRQLVAFERETPRFRLSRIVAAVDFSEPSVAAARAAIRVAALVRAPLTLVHVVPAVQTLPRWAPIAEDQHERQAAAAGADLRDLAAALRDPQLPTVVLTGPPAERLVDFTSAHHDTLVVMGLTGRGHLLGRAAGTIAYRVMSHGRVPVLVVPAGAPGARDVRVPTAAPE